MIRTQRTQHLIAKGSAVGPCSSPAVTPRASFGGRRSTFSSQPAFTLVELLVSVALVVLLMLMFAEVFQLATGAMSRQRGLAENDQRARSLAIVIRADLDKRTFRNVVPFFPGERADTSPTPFSNRRGYFYISENDPRDDTDDVLQFTVDANITTKNSDETPYVGRAKLLIAPLTRNPNQPEADDGNTQPDNAAASPAAEVCYFLRNGNLYRRVLLIRKPLALAGTGAQPTDSNGKDLVDASYPSFWRDFDFSAHYSDNGPIFHGLEDLDNSAAGGQFPLAKPAFRFGHNHVDGQPREYVFDPGPDGLVGTPDDLPASAFMGRFTHEETSHLDFRYPASRPTGNPMDRGTKLYLVAGVVVTGELGPDGKPGIAGVDDDGNGKIDDQSEIGAAGSDDPWRAGARRGEDLLMTNVHSFDIKVWDEGLGMFVDVGHTKPLGDFAITRQLNSDYGPDGYGPDGPVGNRVFDTWHPDLDGAHAPFVPRFIYQTPPVWQPSFNYPYNATVLPTTSSPVRQRIGRAPVWAIVYRCVQSGQSSNTEPAWPTVPGGTVAEDTNGNGIPGEPPEPPGQDRNGNGIPGEPGEPIWQAVYNLKPLKAIQITIRFYDVSSGQLRQMTLVHSLVD